MGIFVSAHWNDDPPWLYLRWPGLESLENKVYRTVLNMATGERVCVNPCEQLWCITVFAFWHSKLICPLFIVFERNTEEIVEK